MLRAVLFDLDGTLFDRLTTVVRCVADQHSRFASALAAVDANTYVERFLQLDGRGYVKKDAVYAEIVGDFALPAVLEEQLFADFYEHFHKHAEAFPGMYDLLRTLKTRNLKLGLITNGTESHQRQTISALAIEDFFDTILISETEGIRKPDVRIFERALERLGVTASEAIFVGDHPEADIDGARAAGIRAIWKRDEFWGDCESADFVVDDLDQLAMLLCSTDIAEYQSGSRI